MEFQYEGKIVKSQPLFADCTYVGQEDTLEKYKMKDETCEKDYQGESTS